MTDQDTDFADPRTGEVNRYAVRAHHRVMALGYYLCRWRLMGHEKAARATCEKYGHERRGARCDRCGSPVGRGAL